MRYRFLEKEDFSALYPAFINAFSDYAIKMQPSKEQFLEMLTRRGIRYDLSVGAFNGEELVGFNLNALDLWKSRLTVYDISTGVIPQYRGQAVAGNMFEFSFPRLKQVSARQYILEVIETNQSAIRAYEKIGFRKARKLECFKLSADPQAFALAESNEIQIRLEAEPNWELFQSFWDWEPSWQNSINSIKRSLEKPALICAFCEGATVGYAIVYPSNGDIPQIAVEKSYRRRGIGTRLLRSLEKQIEAGQFGRMINIDQRAVETLSFTKAVGMEKITDQHEMLLEI